MAILTNLAINLLKSWSEKGKPMPEVKKNLKIKLKGKRRVN